MRGVNGTSSEWRCKGLGHTGKPTRCCHYSSFLFCPCSHAAFSHPLIKVIRGQQGSIKRRTPRPSHIIAAALFFSPLWLIFLFLQKRWDLCLLELPKFGVAKIGQLRKFYQDSFSSQVKGGGCCGQVNLGLVKETNYSHLAHSAPALGQQMVGAKKSVGKAKEYPSKYEHADWGLLAFFNSRPKVLSPESPELGNRPFSATIHTCKVA